MLKLINFWYNKYNWKKLSANISFRTWASCFSGSGQATGGWQNRTLSPFGCYWHWEPILCSSEWSYNVFSGGLYPSDTGNVSKYCLMLPWRQNHLQLQPLGCLHNKAVVKALISMTIILITQSIVPPGEWILWQNLLASDILDNCLVFDQT